MKYEETPIKPKQFIKRKSVMKLTNDITKLPTHEILRRLYKRHSVGVWMTLNIAAWTFAFAK
jgi:hypothetical protein